MRGLSLITLLSVLGSSNSENIPARNLRIPISRTMSESSCKQDMQQLEDNDSLVTAAQSISKDFSSDFNVKIQQYCDISNRNDGITAMDCIVDYRAFSSEYKQVCEDSKANYSPVTLFMQCSTNTSIVEMELVNVPRCLGTSCESDDEKISLSRSLRIDIPGKCHFFHRTMDIVVMSTTIESETESDRDHLDVYGSPNDSSHGDMAIIDTVDTEIIDTADKVSTIVSDNTENEVEKISAAVVCTNASILQKLSVSTIVALSVWLSI